MAEALYRKYRPQVFEDVVGQEPIARTLKNAIAQDKVSHAYLFCGPRGTGKTTMARLVAKALLCEHGPTDNPDGTCEDCRLIAEGMHPDVYELDAASRTGVENVREEIISRVQFAPTRGRYKVYIIDEVHMLSTQAFNALLKTLEEPPSHVVFILCTTDPQKVPETIHSRCQRFDFRRIAPDVIVSRLGAVCNLENVEFEGEALDLIAHRADGGLRNALASLEQIIAFENGKVTLEGAERLLGAIDSSDMATIIMAIGKRDVAGCFRWIAEYVETGADLAQFARDMSEHVRNMYVLSAVGDDVDIDVSDTMRQELVAELQWFGPDRLARMMGVMGDLIAELKTSSNPRLSFEIALTRMVRPDSDLTLEALAERVEALESGYSAVSHVSSAPVAAAPTSTPASAPVKPAASAPAPVPSVEPQPAKTAATASAPKSQPVRTEVPEPASAPAVSVPASTAPAPASAAPAPAQAAPKPASAGGQNLGSLLGNPAALQRVWQATLAALKKNKSAYAVLFLNTRVRGDDEGVGIIIEFPAENPFMFKAVQRHEVQEAFQAALVSAFGQPIPYQFVQANGSAASSPASVPTQPAPAPAPVPAPRASVAQEPAPADSASAATAAAAPAPAEPPVASAPTDVAAEPAAPVASAVPAESSAASAPAEASAEPAASAAPVAPMPEESIPKEASTDDVSDQNGAEEADPEAIESLLQNTFDGGVVFKEV